MKPWKICEHCYLKDKYCENAEREQPCNPVQEYLESTSKIKRLQNLLDVSEREYYKILQQLAIATKDLKEISETDWWWRAKQASKRALKEITLAGTSTKEE